MNPQYRHIFNKASIDLTTLETVLDVGCGEGIFSNFLHAQGIKVTAIDKENQPELHTGIKFEKTTFEDFESGEVFDLVHARNVVPFMENKPKQVARMLTMGRHILFTFFGPHDPWQNLVINKEEIVPILKDVEILYSSEEEFVGKTMNGDKKPWHIFTYVVKTGL